MDVAAAAADGKISVVGNGATRSPTTLFKQVVGRMAMGRHRIAAIFAQRTAVLHDPTNVMTI
jgi:hypothetical protein